MADINIYGTLHAATGDGVLARAEQIEDTDSGKKQSEINADVAKQLDAVQAMAHSTASHFYHLGTLADQATILSRAAQYAVVSDPNVTFITALYPAGDVLQSIVIQQQVTKSSDGSGVCMQYVFKDKSRWTRYVNFNAAGSVTGTQSLQSDVPRNLNLTANGGLSLRGLWGGAVGSGVTLPNKNDLREGTATASTVPLVLTKSVKDTATCELQPATTARAGVMTVEQVQQLADAKAKADREAGSHYYLEGTYADLEEIGEALKGLPEVLTNEQIRYIHATITDDYKYEVFIFKIVDVAEHSEGHHYAYVSCYMFTNGIYKVSIEYVVDETTGDFTLESYRGVHAPFGFNLSYNRRGDGANIALDDYYGNNLANTHIPSATIGASGLMTASHVQTLNNVSSKNTSEHIKSASVAPSATSATLSLKNASGGDVVRATLPLAVTGNAGLLSGDDKDYIDLTKQSYVHQVEEIYESKEALLSALCQFDVASNIFLRRVFMYYTDTDGNMYPASMEQQLYINADGNTGVAYQFITLNGDTYTRNITINYSGNGSCTRGVLVKTFGNSYIMGYDASTRSLYGQTLSGLQTYKLTLPLATSSSDGMMSKTDYTTLSLLDKMVKNDATTYASEALMLSAAAAFDIVTDDKLTHFTMWYNASGVTYRATLMQEVYLNQSSMVGYAQQYISYGGLQYTRKVTFDMSSRTVTNVGSVVKQGASTLTFVQSTRRLNLVNQQGGVMSYVTLPTATTTYAGLMSPGQAKSLSDLASRVAALEAAVGIS